MKYTNLSYNGKQVQEVKFGGSRYSSNQTYTITGLSPDTQYYAAPYMKVNGATVYGSTIKFKTKGDPQKPDEPVYPPVNPSAAKAIDMGTSVYWAEWNYGASNKWEYGTYVGWGQQEDELNSINNSDYANGFNETSIAGTEYDIVHKKWGGKWRMPTKADFEELFSKCYEDKTEQQYIVIDGEKIYGDYFHSKTNENTIFIPASGYKILDATNRVNSWSYVWTGDMENGEPVHCMPGKSYYKSDLSKYVHVPIRPVWDPKMPGDYEVNVKPEYIDLGLSVKWGKYNIGASSVRDAGQYIAWGNVSGYYYNQKNKTEINNINYSISGNRQYDIATALWGEHWRLPTKQEFNELKNYIENSNRWNYEESNGFKKYKLTDTKGNVLIEFPFCGYKDFVSGLNYNDKDPENENPEGVLPESELDGYYWTGDCSEESLLSAKYVLFQGRGVGQNSGDALKSWRFFIRPVYDDGGKTSEVDPPTSEASDGIDLGLPSGNLWATYNVGATKESDSGIYVAWGELESKNEYSKSNYAYLNESDTKHGGYSLVLGNNIAKTKYDVATQRWKGNWQMPTDSDMRELRDYCRWSPETVNNTSGYRLTGPNGNSIFLPMSGSYNGNNFISNEGIYWASTMYLFANEYQNGYTLTFSDNTGYEVSRYSRKNGCTVRPVQHVDHSRQSKVTISVHNGKLKYNNKEFRADRWVTYYFEHFTTQTFEIIPDAGFVIDVVKINRVNEGIPNNNILKLDISPNVNYTIYIVCIPKNTESLKRTPGEAIDMGDGIYWADRNLGADNELESGYYIAWGELVPKDSYTRDNYQYYDKELDMYIDISDPVGTSGGRITEGQNFNVYNYEKDAARFLWGGDWRLPTQQEMSNLWLNENNTWEWTTKENQQGMQVTNSTTGNSIFFPACGVVGDNTVVNSDFCEYWTSSYDTHRAGQGNKGYALNLAVSSNTVHNLYTNPMPGIYRYRGLCIRPVKTKVANAPAPETSNGITTEMVECSDNYISNYKDSAKFKVSYKSQSAVTEYGLAWSSINSSPQSSDANKIKGTDIGIEGNVEIWKFLPTEDYWTHNSSQQPGTDPGEIITGGDPELDLRLIGTSTFQKVYYNNQSLIKDSNQLCNSGAFSMLIHQYAKNTGGVTFTGMDEKCRISNIDDYAYIIYRTAGYNRWPAGSSSNAGSNIINFSTNNSPKISGTIKYTSELDETQNILLRGDMTSKTIRIPSTGTKGEIGITRYPLTFYSELYLQESGIGVVNIDSVTKEAKYDIYNGSYNNSEISCEIESKSALDKVFKYNISNNITNNYREFLFVLSPIEKNYGGHNISELSYINTDIYSVSLQFVQEPYNKNRIYYGTGFGYQNKYYNDYSDEYYNAKSYMENYKYHYFFEACNSKIVNDSESATIKCKAYDFIAFPIEFVGRVTLPSNNSYSRVSPTEGYSWGKDKYIILQFNTETDIKINKL